MEEQGLVLKKGKYLKRWKWRWFVKEGDTLYSYKANKHKDKPRQLKGTFDFKHWKITLLGGQGDKENRKGKENENQEEKDRDKKEKEKEKEKAVKKRKDVYVFQMKHVVTQERYLLKTSSREEMEKWIKVSTVELIKSKYAECIRQIVKVQCFLKGKKAKEGYNKLKAAAETVQTLVRKRDSVQSVLAVRNSVELLQTLCRRWKERRQYVQLVNQVQRIQNIVKTNLAQQTLKKMRLSALKLQTLTRRFLAQKELQSLKFYTVKVQSLVRRRAARKQLEDMKKVVRIQTFIRRIWAIGKLQRERANVQKVQALIRRNLARREYEKKKEVATKFQAIMRRSLAVREWENVKDRTVALQSICRKIGCTAQYRRSIKKVVKIQSLARLFFVKKLFKQHVQRKRIVTELVITEQTYVSNLRLVVEIYIKPLQDLCKTENAILTPTELFDIFMNWEVLLNVNVLLLRKLEERLKKWSVEHQVGDVFSSEEFLALRSVYENFIVRLDHSTQCLEATKKKSTAFTDFLAQAGKDPRCKKLNLDSFLILPVQRLPRYELLLRDLLKSTTKTHPDYEGLLNGLETVKKITTAINQRKKEMDEAKQSILLMQKLGHYFIENKLSLGKGISFIKEGEISFNSEKKVQRLVLFDDRLLLVIVTKDKYIVREALPFLQIKNVEAKKNYLEIATQTGVITLSIKSATDGRGDMNIAWATEILNAITTYYGRM